jgi:protease-4
MAGLSGEDIGNGNVAVIPVKGVIVTDGSSFSSDLAASTEIVRLIKQADDNDAIDAIILDINSPGGLPVASDEIGNAIKSVNKTTVALIRDIGASGGYWVASGCDVIIANRMSMVGSIGVIGSYLDFGEFLDDKNVTYNRLVAGRYKDMGTPWKELTREEEALFQEQLDALHNIFILEVSDNRNMSVDEVTRLAEGQIFIGKEAKALGLVDILGGEDEAKNHLEKLLGKDVNFRRYQKTPGLLDILAGVMNEHAYHMGTGLGDSLTKDLNKNRIII